MTKEMYVVIEYNGFVADPKEYIVGVFTSKEDAELQAKLINDWSEKDSCDLVARVDVASLDKFYC